MIVYTVLNDYDRVIEQWFTDLEDALDQITLDLVWNITPVSLVFDGRYLDIEAIRKLLRTREALVSTVGASICPS